MRIGPVCPIAGASVSCPRTRTRAVRVFLSSFLASWRRQARPRPSTHAPVERRRFRRSASTGSSVTVNGTYCLLPCAFSRSSPTHASDRSFGAGCPAAASSTIFRWPGSLSSRRLLSFSLFLALSLCQSDAETSQKRAPRKRAQGRDAEFTINLSLHKKSITRKQPIIGGSPEPSQTTSTAVFRAKSGRFAYAAMRPRPLPAMKLIDVTRSARFEPADLPGQHAVSASKQSSAWPTATARTCRRCT